MKKQSLRRLVLSFGFLLLVCMIGQSPSAGNNMPTPKMLKQQAINDLMDLLPAQDYETGKWIEMAIDNLNKSLDSSLWENGNTLTQKGNKVFDEEKQAVNKLMKIKGIDVSGIIDFIVSIDMNLAQIAIDRATDSLTAAGCYDKDNKDPECKKQLMEIAKAEIEMEKAQEECNRGKYDNAVDRYKKAWMHAQIGLQTLPEIGKILFASGYDEECDGWGNYMYLYDGATGIWDLVRGNCENNIFGYNLNPDLTKIVYAEITSENGDSTEEHSTIKIYDIASKNTTIINTATASNGYAVFAEDGKILFIDSIDGILKKIDTDETDIITVATPDSPYVFNYFWISPDREKIIIVENIRVGDYYTGNYERLVLMNSDGTNRSVIKDEFLGNWNYVIWKTDSSGFLYYHHVFNGLSGEEFQSIPKYISFDISGKTVKTKDLSNSDLGIEENILFYTKSGNLVNLGYRVLYDGKNGRFLADLSSEIPPPEELFNMLGGWDIHTGELYIANFDGTNLRRLNIMEL